MLCSIPFLNYFPPEAKKKITPWQHQHAAQYSSWSGDCHNVFYFVLFFFLSSVMFDMFTHILATCMATDVTRSVLYTCTHELIYMVRAPATLGTRIHTSAGGVN